MRPVGHQQVMSACPSPLPVCDTDLICSVFDALPLPAFVVDHEFCVIDFNVAGARLLERVPFALLRLRGDERVQCVHSTGTGDDESVDACHECVVGNFVREVFDFGKPVRKPGRLRLTRGGKTADLDFVITVAPIPDDAEPLALLILDDAGELSALVESRTPGISPASSSPGSKDPATAPGHRTDNS